MSMIERRFWFVIDNGKLEYVQDLVTGEKITVSELEDLLNELNDENRQLKQILKDIVEVTDETYTKNTSICKVIAVFDYKKYLKIKECLNE